jgi:hypothetical protein
MIHFDEAVGEAVAVLQGRFPGALPETTIVRDPIGQITAVLPDDALPEGDWSPLADELHARLCAFSPGPRAVLVAARDLIDRQDVLASRDRVAVPGVPGVWLVDRLLTNQDWLRVPLVSRPALPLATAFSLKGGVGRTTAVAVWSWHLARLGHRVLAIDLDLEAPGLGATLLDDLPSFGLVDWLVEGLVGQADAQLLEDCLAFSPIADQTPGIIRVMPAFGNATRDYVPKLGRVYLPAASPSGAQAELADRLAFLIELTAQLTEPPDIVLLDARAGLHDIGAAAVTRLGAEVFLFARDEAQSWTAWRHLFEHLRVSSSVRWGMPDDDLRWRMRMVAAQVAKSESALGRWIDAAYQTWSELYDAEPLPTDAPAADEGTAQTFARDDEEAPHQPLPIYFDPALQGLRLVDPNHRPEWAVLDATFGRFLRGATARLLPSLEPDDDTAGTDR